MRRDVQSASRDRSRSDAKLEVKEREIGVLLNKVSRGTFLWWDQWVQLAGRGGSLTPRRGEGVGGGQGARGRRAARQGEWSDLVFLETAWQLEVKERGIGVLLQ